MHRLQACAHCSRPQLLPDLRPLNVVDTDEPDDVEDYFAQLRGAGRACDEQCPGNPIAQRARLPGAVTATSDRLCVACPFKDHPHA